MSGFHIHAGNRVERLLEALAGVVSTPLSRPLAREVVLVQSAGMERWLVRELSARFGVWANARFPFPNVLVSELFESVLGKVPDADLFSSEALTWRIMALLPPLLERPGFESLRNYLGGETSGLKALQLCSRIADTFDQYTLYRPAMVLSWESGAEPGDWQAQLWRELVREQPGSHRAAVRRRFFARLEKCPPPPGAFPERIAIFGIPAMPPFHLEVLSAVSRFVDIHLFHLNPSVEYWGDIVSRKEQVRLRSRKAGSASPPGEEHYETGNPLLASMGKLGRDFSELLLEVAGGEGEGYFEEPEGGTALASLQADILLLRERGGDGGRRAAEPSDRSIRFHSVHGAMREMEVLHDQLTDLFQADPTLEPHDVVVMTPAIEEYAPYVTAVFGEGGGRRGTIPFSLADRPASAESPVIRTFLEILSMRGSRFGASEVAALLESPVIRRKFRFSSEDAEAMLRWVAESRIRWGVDAADRAARGLPAFGENSWTSGLDRLLLGYALSGDDERPFLGILPIEGVEGSRGLLLGRLAEFAQTLFEEVRGFETDRSPSEWSARLGEMLPRFIEADEAESGEYRDLSERISRLGEVACRSGFTAPVPVDVVRHALERQFGGARAARGFLTGGVTFCEMLPMRSVPFRVVAMVGMDSGRYPRQGRPPGFDRIAREPMKGDRSLREEDRYLFLEAILSARDTLYVSYVGQSIVDNSEIPPSVLVSELLDELGDGIEVVRHPLQPFSPAYFDGSRGLFSYSDENLNALRSRGSAQRIPPFLSVPLPDPPSASRHVTASELKRFFRGPAEYFLRNRLGLHLERSREPGQDREPFSLDPLERYLLLQRVSERAIAGGSPDEIYPAVRASGVLPPGAPGDIEWRKASAEAGSFAAAVLRSAGSDPLEPVDVDLPAGPFRVTGRIDGIRREGLLRYRCAGLKAKDLLSAWIDHLLLRAAAPEGYPDACNLVGKDEGIRFAPVPDPAGLLSDLLEVYRAGLCEPIPFFPECSLEFRKAILAGRPEEEARNAARGKWEGGRFDHGPAEGDDPWNALAFRSVEDPVALDRFAHYAGSVYSPLLAHRGPL